MSEIIFAALIGGISALVGSLIGGLAVIITVVIQLKSQRKLETDNRLFASRKDAYEKALADISHGHSERMNGRMWPPSSQHPDNRKVNDVLAVVSLYSSKELVAEMVKLFHYLTANIPSNPILKAEEDATRTVIWQNIIREMRKELGTGDFLEVSIPDMPQNNL
jgi:hypothetical protein